MKGDRESPEDRRGGSGQARRIVVFTSFFDKLAGGPSLREAVQRGDDEARIRESWKPAIAAFKHVRAKYLLYEDFR